MSLLGGVLLASSTPLDEFLSGSSSGRGEMWRRLGLGIEVAGVLAAVGVLAFLIWCHRGRRSDARALLTVAAGAGAAMASGAAIELAGIARQFQVGWLDVLDVDASSAPVLRLIAGVSLLFGLDESSVSEADDQQEVEVRWSPGAASAFGLAGAGAGAASFAFDGHTVTEGPRALHALVNVVHLLAGGMWLGGVLALAVLLARERRLSDALAGTVVRFSKLAAVGLATVATAGLAMVLMILDDTGDVTRTEWGRRLIVKTVAVAAAAAIAGFNNWALVPSVRRGLTPGVASRLRIAVLCEAAVLAVVVVVTSLLVSASTTG